MSDNPWIARLLHATDDDYLRRIRMEIQGGVTEWGHTTLDGCMANTIDGVCQHGFRTWGYVAEVWRKGTEND